MREFGAADAGRSGTPDDWFSIPAIQDGAKDYDIGCFRGFPGFQLLQPAIQAHAVAVWAALWLQQ